MSSIESNWRRISRACAIARAVFSEGTRTSKGRPCVVTTWRRKRRIASLRLSPQAFSTAVARSFKSSSMRQRTSVVFSNADILCLPHINVATLWLRSKYGQPIKTDQALFALNRTLRRPCVGNHKAGQRRKKWEKSTYPPPADGLCVPFLCKRGVGCKRCPRPSPLRGLGAVSQLHRVQGFAKKCSGLAHASRGGRGVVTQARCPVYGDYGCENLQQAVFSFSEPFISGANPPLSNPTQKRL